MTTIVKENEIRQCVNISEDIIPIIENAFVSLSNGEGWLLQSETNNFKIEKNIFLGNKNKIINNESISSSGQINGEIILIKWKIERIN